jgi:parvulin-like peptidyl-prolyl isomerase
MYSLVKDDIIAQHVLQIAAEVANEEFVKDIAPTEEEVKAKYDEYVAQDKEDLEADPTMYVSYFIDDSPAYYVPAGVRQVLHVLTAIDDDTQAAISLLRGEGYDDQADILRNNALAKIEDEANDLLSKLESGELDFAEAAMSDAYSDDEGMVAEGYPVVEGTTDYAEEFTAASMGLEKVGDMTGLVATDFGYHIIKYIGDAPEGAVSYDSVHDEIAEALKTSQQVDAWQAQLDQWEEESDIVYYEENL